MITILSISSAAGLSRKEMDARMQTQPITRTDLVGVCNVGSLLEQIKKASGLWHKVTDLSSVFFYIRSLGNEDHEQFAFMQQYSFTVLHQGYMNHTPYPDII